MKLSLWPFNLKRRRAAAVVPGSRIAPRAQDHSDDQERTLDLDLDPASLSLSLSLPLERSGLGMASKVPPEIWVRCVVWVLVGNVLTRLGGW